MLRRTYITALSITAFVLFNMGMDRINFGPAHGFNPVLALPTAAVCLIVVLALTYRVKDGS
jgi:hypothetical protein